jgi:hypothetical protein
VAEPGSRQQGEERRKKEREFGFSFDLLSISAKLGKEKANSGGY